MSKQAHEIPSSHLQEREYLLEQIEKRPDSSWRSNSMWTFRNEAKIYGSPMFDAAWNQAMGKPSAMPQLLQTLRSKDAAGSPAV